MRLYSSTDFLPGPFFFFEDVAPVLKISTQISTILSFWGKKYSSQLRKSKLTAYCNIHPWTEYWPLPGILDFLPVASTFRPWEEERKILPSSRWLTCSCNQFPFFWICNFSPSDPSLILPPTTPCSGYAVTAGHFSQPTTTDIVGGAPQDGGIGKVWFLMKLWRPY